MALKALRLRKKIELKTAELNTLREKDKEFETREAELTRSIEEAETEEDQALVDDEIDKFTQEKEEHEGAEKTLEDEIRELERELEETEKEPPAPGINENERGGMRNMQIRANIRELPMNVRAFDALTREERASIVASDEVQQFLAEVRSVGKNKRAVSGADLTIPVVFLDLISENMFRYSKLINRVRVRNVSGEARQTIAGTVPEAVWTEMCGAINELTFQFNQVTVDGYKVAGYISICNSTLEDSDIDLAATIVEMISEAIGLAKDKAILYGKGAAGKMPLGIVTRLAQTAKPSDYPANAPEWVDLHTTNIKKIGADLKGADFWAALVVALGNTFTTYSRGEQFWAMNSKTHALLRSKMITFTATGDIAANIYATLPIVTGDIDILEFMPDGDIIGGYGDLYLWAQRKGMSIEETRECQFIQDNTVFKGKERADGTPVVPGAFVAVNISGNEVTTTMPFAADEANDALLDALALGTETLSPVFAANKFTYNVTASGTIGKIDATPARGEAEVEITYNGKNVNNGGTVTFATGNKPLAVTVKNGNAVNVYTINVNKAGS